MDTISFNISAKDRFLVDAIVKRGVRDGIIIKAHRKDVTMDLIATHANGNPIDFHRLLVADGFNFGHDVGGIRRNLNRETGKLENCFVPRFSSPKSREAA